MSSSGSRSPRRPLAEDVLLQQRFLDLRTSRVRLPWERGINGLVFGDRSPPSPVLPMPSNLNPCPSPFRHDLGDLPTATQLFAVKRARCARLFQSEDSLRFEAMRKVKIMCLLDPEASELGRSISAEAAGLVDDSVLMGSFSDTFAGKSTATMCKRAASMWRFFEFCVQHGLGSPLRAGEKVVYSFIKHLQESAAPTSGQAFVEAWRFFSGMLGFRLRPEESPLSGRVKGAVASLLSQKKKLVQAAPLTVLMIKALERIVLEPPLPHWRVIAGHILFCIGSSSRFSDTVHLDCLTCVSDQGIYLVEGASCSYKTGTGERKSVLLPLLSLGRFILDDAWAPVWMQAREDAGLGLNPSLPGFSEPAQTWLDRRMTTGELTLYLREFVVGSGIQLLQDDRTSSHSLKCTVLSWLSKAGGVSLEDRRIAGHHLDPANRSALTYSRDELCRLMHTEERILIRIRRGVFKPDDSRVMRLAAMVKEDTGVQSLKEWKLEGDMTFPQLDEDDSDCGVATLEARASGVVLEAIPASQLGPVYSKMHCHSRTVHIEATEGSKFLCGRPVNKNFVDIDKSVALADLLVCKGCSLAYKASA